MEAKMKNIPFGSVTLTGGFWKAQQDKVRTVTMKAIYDRFSDTGRFDGFRCAWKEGDDESKKPHIFWDSDIAKWLEAAAYFLEKQPDDFFTGVVDETVAHMIENQDENGYYNQYFSTFKEEPRFALQWQHELYSLGHLIEAAVAYSHATGKDDFLHAVEKYADYVEKVFVKDKSSKFPTPGHEEIELALVKLYDHTGERRYLDLAKHFIDTRGTDAENENAKNIQTHLPVREQKTAEGHAVRAAYLYTAMADLALRCDDDTLKTACDTLFENIISRRMYITGGIGSSSNGEAFSFDYDLPNARAYSESCAAIGLVFFCRRMQELAVNSVYADTIERVLYNGYLSSISLDGKSFFYENQLEIDRVLLERAKYEKRHLPITQRVEVFGCSCCPPNIARLAASIGDYIASTDGNTVYLHQFISSETALSLASGSGKLAVKSGLPFDGDVKVAYSGSPATLAVRLPYWSASVGFSRNPDRVCGGYAYYAVKDGDTLTFDFDMTPRFIEANPAVHEDNGRCAVMRGPVVWCMEGVDNGENIRDIIIDSAAPVRLDTDPRLPGVPVMRAGAFRRPAEDFPGLYAPLAPSRRVPFEATLIPYFAFANRGESEMLIWTLVK